MIQQYITKDGIIEVDTNNYSDTYDGNIVLDDIKTIKKDSVTTRTQELFMAISCTEDNVICTGDENCSLSTVINNIKTGHTALISAIDACTTIQEVCDIEDTR